MGYVHERRAGSRVIEPKLGVTGPPHNGGGVQKSTPHLRESLKGLRESHSSPCAPPPHNGGESDNMRGSLRESQHFQILSGSPP